MEAVVRRLEFFDCRECGTRVGAISGSGLHEEGMCLDCWCIAMAVLREQARRNFDDDKADSL